MYPRVAHLLKASFDAQKSEEWLKLRRQMLTASDVATALGLNPFKTARSLLLEKVLPYGQGSTFKGNEATFHGEKYENEARELYCSMRNEVAHDLGLVQHDTIPWIGGSADGVTESGILLEIKCPLNRQIKDGVPSYYVPQIQILMEILDLDICDFIQYKPKEVFGTQELLINRVHRDREWFAQNLPIMKAFWDDVLYKREHGLLEIILH